VIANIQKRNNVKSLLQTAVAFGCAKVLVVGQPSFQFEMERTDTSSDTEVTKNKTKSDLPTSLHAHGQSGNMVIQRFASWNDLVVHCNAKSILLVGVEIHPEAHTIDDFVGNHTTTTDSHNQIAFVMGNEGQGLNDKQLKSCGAFVRIPQYGIGTASLNVNVAASIVLSRCYYQWHC